MAGAGVLSGNPGRVTPASRLKLRVPDSVGVLEDESEGDGGVRLCPLNDERFGSAAITSIT